MERGSEVKAKDFKFGVVYNFGRNLSNSYQFIVLRMEKEYVRISDNDLISEYGLILLSDTSDYFFDRELTDLEKVLL